MKLEKIICPVCGSNEVVEKDGCFYCLSCETKLTNRENNTNFVSYIARQCDAETSIKLNRFDDALEKFNLLIKEFPNKSEPYWGSIRAKYGIKYETADGTAIPTCFNCTYVDIRKDKNFAKAVELAESKELREKYISEGDKIASICKEWSEEAKKYDYDIFLSFKQTDNGIETYDCRFMRQLYNVLTEKYGFKVFYAPISTVKITGNRYEPYVFNALDKSKVFIICGSKPEYFESTWVENEWRRFFKKIQNGEKEKNSLIVLYGDFNPEEELPKLLAYRQGYPMAKALTLLDDLCPIILEIIEKTNINQPIEKIKVEKREQGIKKIERADISLQNIGSNVEKKKSFVPTGNFIIRNLENNGICTPESGDKLKSAKNLLKINRFIEAKELFEECIKDDSTNGQAYLGLLATCTEDYLFFHDMDLSNNFCPRKLSYNELDLLNNQFALFDKIIQYSEGKNQAERILEFLYRTVLMSAIFTENNENSNLIYKTFCIINSYNSRIREECRNNIIENFTNICLKNASILDSVCEELIDTLGDSSIDEYLELIEKIITSFCLNKEYDYANKWNDLKLAHYLGDVVSTKRKLFFLTKTFSIKEFINKHYTDSNISNIAIEYLQKNIEYFSLIGINEIFDFVITIEKECCNDDATLLSLKNAEKYFAFLVKYNFASRNDFIEFNLNKMRLLASFGLYTFFNNIISAINHSDPDFYIDYLNFFGQELLKNNFYDEAGVCFEEVSKYQEYNYEAYKGLFFAKYNINLEKFSVNASEIIDEDFLKNVLSLIEDTTEQNEFINKVILCYIANINLSNYKQVNQNFDLLIKYYDCDLNILVDVINNIGLVNLRLSLFESANKYALLSIKLKGIENPIARKIELYSFLKSSNDEMLIKCEKFNRNLQQYKNYLISCGDNVSELEKCTWLADEHDKFLELEKEKNQKNVLNNELNKIDNNKTKSDKNITIIKKPKEDKKLLVSLSPLQYILISLAIVTLIIDLVGKATNLIYTNGFAIIYLFIDVLIVAGFICGIIKKSKSMVITFFIINFIYSTIFISCILLSIKQEYLDVSEIVLWWPQIVLFVMLFLVYGLSLGFLKKGELK